MEEVQADQPDDFLEYSTNDIYSRNDPVHERLQDILCSFIFWFLHLLIRPELWMWPIDVNNTFV